ncbi:MAG: hypothetical protein EOP88_17235 [Verrucomicrobiaceae bacterium]|nr:MAG: hypothetical protein EOP88_17235 [Verrucomicrobiaceae bacterium]
MKLQRVVILTGCAAWMVSAATAAEARGSVHANPSKQDPGKNAGSPESPEKPPAKPLPDLIGALSDPSFRVREEASRAIWGAGESALAELKKAAAGKDPEQAFRARELIRKIQLFITPGTDPDVIRIVERYEKAGVDEKVDLFAELRQKRAWRQMLKLYAGETNAQVHSRLQGQGIIEPIPVTAARECLKNGDTAGAREFLEMAPADAAGLLSLADFHRSQGTLEQELKRAMTLEGKQGAAWRLALYRASGNIGAARDAAVEAGEPDLAAAFSLLLGDPLPWLRRESVGNHLRDSRKLYTELATKRWQGSPLRPADLEPLEKAVNSRNRGERNGAIAALVLLGEPQLAEKSFARYAPLEAFSYFESQERIPEALSVLGIDAAKPNYENWVRERIQKLAEDPEEDEDGGMTVDHDQELIILAGFLERRGLDEINAAAFTAPLESLASKDEEVFLGFITRLFLDGVRLGAPDLAHNIVASWAGQDEKRWDQAISQIFSDNEDITSLWDWMAELDSTATLPDRLRGLLALRGMGADPDKLGERWKRLAWTAVEALPVEKRQPLLPKLISLVNMSPDAASSLRMWELLPEESRSQYFWQGTHALNLSAVGRWDDVAAFHKSNIERVAQMNIEPQPEWHASVAASLRQAGHPEEAAKQDALVETLALGRDAIAIGINYAFNQDHKRAADWWTRALLQVDPDAHEFGSVLQLAESMMMDNGRWKEAAAISEARARTLVSGDLASSPDQMQMLTARGLRLNSDLARALDHLTEDRAGSIAMLANCHRLYPADAGIADNFFPALRKVGLMKEHDAWFKESWERIMAVVDEFPGAHNTGNSAAWLASRARRNLDEAEAILEKSLAASPRQSAYLDTMAEIQFARGDREKAIKWSDQAVNFDPTDEMLRRQHERFRTAPLPR